MNKRGDIFFILIFLYQITALSQSNDVESNSIFETRFDKYLKSNRHLNLVTSTDHLPLFVNNPLDHWISSKSELYIDGISFNQFPLNFNSPNLLPLNFPYAFYSKKKSFPEIKLFGSAPLGFIDVRQDPVIQDTFTLKLRSYIGSETGDPLIHVFTKNHLEQGNKNKIPLSGSVSASNKISEFGYRFSLGVYGNFSTGSVNDNIIFNKSNYFSGKQNKQIFGSFGLKYYQGNKKEYSLSGSAISYYGWDTPPFLTSFVHFETYFYTLRASADNLIDGLSLLLINDGSITAVHGGNGIPGTKFNLSQYKLLSKFENDIGNFSYALSTDINYNTANSSNVSDTLSIKFFSEEIEKINYGINLYTSFSPLEDISTKFKLRLDRDYFNKAALSGNIDLEFRLAEKDLLSLNISSITAFPNLTELYGSFLFINYSSPDTFIISGNKNLLSERINHLGLQYSVTMNRINFNAELFGEKIDYPIRQRTHATIISESGEILRDGIYINSSGKKTAGINFNLQCFINQLKFFTSYKFAENSEILYYPKHSVFTKLVFKLTIDSDIQLKFNYSGKTMWEEFIVDEEDDHYKNQGSSGELGENLFFDFAYYQYLNEFYFFKSMVLGFTIQNILNKKIRYLPIGNYLERTIIFSFNSEI